MTKEIKLEKIIYILILSCLFVTIWVIDSKIRFFGDDWFYYQFAQYDLTYFINRHIEHYYLANGRVIVHLLVTILTKLPHVFWEIVNAFFITSSTMKIVDLAIMNDDKEPLELLNLRIITLLLCVFGLATMNRAMTEQSMFWLTGSLNYVYPLWLFLAFTHRFLYKKHKEVDIPIIILGFFAAATVEQAGMMALGVVVLVLGEKIILNKVKLSKLDGFLFLATLVGYCTVILAPSVLLRASIEETQALNITDQMLINIRSQWKLLLTSQVMLTPHVFAFLGVISTLVSLFKSKKMRIHDWIISIYGLVSILSLAYFYLAKASGLYLPSFYNYNIVLIGFMGGGYILVLFYTGILTYEAKAGTRTSVPIVALILGFGSVIMLLISPVFGFRNLIYIYMLLTLYGLSLIRFKSFSVNGLLPIALYCILTNRLMISTAMILIIILLKLLRSKSTKQSYFIVIKKLFAISVIGLFILRFFYASFVGYGLNTGVYDLNIKNAEIYVANIDLKESNKVILYQKKLPTFDYRWVMPYDNSYYDDYYKLYLGIDMDTEILWED